MVALIVNMACFADLNEIYSLGGKIQKSYSLQSPTATIRSLPAAGFIAPSAGTFFIYIFSHHILP